MFTGLFEGVRWRWNSFAYNFQWSNYTYLFSGNIAKFSLYISMLGYAVLFNDSVAQYLNFKQVTSPKVDTLFLSTEARIRFLYFGFVLLGIAEGTYLLFRPFAIKLGADF